MGRNVYVKNSNSGPEEASAMNDSVESIERSSPPTASDSRASPPLALLLAVAGFSLACHRVLHEIVGLGTSLDL